MIEVITGNVASRTESRKLDNFSNFKSVVCYLCRMSLQVIERHRDASKLRIFDLEGGKLKNSALMTSNDI